MRAPPSPEREGFLPRLCIDHQDFEEIGSPFIRAWQKCRGCRGDGTPFRSADGLLRHATTTAHVCLAVDEWMELERSKASRV